MLLIWYTPPRAGAQQVYANWLMRRREYNYIEDEEETLLLLWWGLINLQETK